MGLDSLCDQIPVPRIMSPVVSSSSGDAAAAVSVVVAVSPFSWTPAFASWASKLSSSGLGVFFFFFFFRAEGSNSPSAAGAGPSLPSVSSLGFLDDFFFLFRPLKSSFTSSTAGSDFAGWVSRRRTLSVCGC